MRPLVTKGSGRPLSGLRIGVFGKGGSGKSTVTCFLAMALQETGYTVLVLDADSTNVGLASALAVNRKPDPLLEYFGGMVFSGGSVTCPVDDPTVLEGARLSLSDLPPRFRGMSSAGILLLVAGKLGALGPGAGCDGPVAKIARDLRVEDRGPDPVTLVDYKAGFEDAARGALTSVDWALVVVDPTCAAVQMAVHLALMVADIRRGVPPATRHLQRADLAALAVRLFREARVRGAASVLNRVPSPETEGYLRVALRGSGAPVLAVFGQDAGVADQWLRGGRLRSAGLRKAAGALARQLEARVGEAAREALARSTGRAARAPAMEGSP